jgi:hypothetical protein
LLDADDIMLPHRVQAQVSSFILTVHAYFSCWSHAGQKLFAIFFFTLLKIWRPRAWLIYAIYTCWSFQLAVALHRPHTLIGSKFTRIPADATPRYSNWLNGMNQEELYTQRFRENTIIQPTFFFHRQVFERAGPYIEGGSTWV